MSSDTALFNSRKKLGGLIKPGHRSQEICIDHLLILLKTIFIRFHLGHNPRGINDQVQATEFGNDFIEKQVKSYGLFTLHLLAIDNKLYNINTFKIYFYIQVRL